MFRLLLDPGIGTETHCFAAYGISKNLKEKKLIFGSSSRPRSGSSRFTTVDSDFSQIDTSDTHTSGCPFFFFFRLAMPWEKPESDVWFRRWTIPDPSPQAMMPHMLTCCFMFRCISPCSPCIRCLCCSATTGMH